MVSKSAEMIHRQMTIDDILNSFPQKGQRLAQEMANTGLQCVGCHASTFETLEQGMSGHGMSDQMINDLVNRLNAILAEKGATGTISLTERAATKYLEILSNDGKQGWGIRFAEKRSGCSGYQYLLDFSEQAGPEDKVFESYGIEIHIHNEMVERLLGSEIDYLEGLQSSGFKVSNPNVSKSCGCGHSHGYKP